MIIPEAESVTVNYKSRGQKGAAAELASLALSLSCLCRCFSLFFAVACGIDW